MQDIPCLVVKGHAACTPSEAPPAIGLSNRIDQCMPTGG